MDEEEIARPSGNLAEMIISSSIMMLIVISLIASVIGFLFANIIASSLQTIADAMHNIAEGDADLTQRLDESNNDELAEIAHHFNSFLLRIQTVIQD